MVEGWFYNKTGGFLLCCRADGGRKEIGEMRAHSFGNNLNIINGFTGNFYWQVHFADNLVCINDTLSLFNSFFSYYDLLGIY